MQTIEIHNELDLDLFIGGISENSAEFELSMELDYGRASATYPVSREKAIEIIAGLEKVFKL